MYVYQLVADIEHEGSNTLMIADNYDKALKCLVNYLNECIYLGNVDGTQTEKGPNIFRHFQDYNDIYTIWEVSLNELMDRPKNRRAVFQISRYGSLGSFVKSSAFYKGKDFSLPQLVYWNEITSSWA